MAIRSKKFPNVEEITAYICEELAKGRSLNSICKEPNMPNISTVMDWVKDDAEFAEKYARAREKQAEFLFDEILEIADANERDMLENGVVNHEHIARSRLRVDTRKWFLSKVLPKKYGERVVVQGDKDADSIEHTHKHTLDSDDKEILKRYGVKTQDGA